MVEAAMVEVTMTEVAMVEVATIEATMVAAVMLEAAMVDVAMVDVAMVEVAKVEEPLVSQKCQVWACKRLITLPLHGWRVSNKKLSNSQSKVSSIDSGAAYRRLNNQHSRPWKEDVAVTINMYVSIASPSRYNDHQIMRTNRA